MFEDASFVDLMARIRAGDQQAAARVFRQFGQRLIALARSWLDTAIRKKLDPEDVVQSAFKSFFVRHAGGEYDIAGWDSLWSLLVVITLRKCGHRVEYFRAARRDVRREVVQPGPADDSKPSWELLAQDPSPLQAALLSETVQHLMRFLEQPHERQILELKLQGYTEPEISTQVSRSERTVRRVLQRVRQRLELLEEQDVPAV